MVTLAALEFESGDFLGAMLVDHGSRDAGTLDDRIADFGRGTVTNHEHFAERSLAADLDVNFFYVDFVALLDFILLSAGFENCVGHGLGCSC